MSHPDKFMPVATQNVPAPGRLRSDPIIVERAVERTDPG
jgi:hypothetical protein